MQLGLENKKKTMWAAILGGVALVYGAYTFIPMFTGPSSTAASTTPPPSPSLGHSTLHPGGRVAKKNRLETLDPTLRLDLLATSEQTHYEGSGHNIFVAQQDEVAIPKPVSNGRKDVANNDGPGGSAGPNGPPPIPPPPPIPLKFFGFASKPGEPKKVFLSHDDDVFVAGEGEIVDRRYKVMRISNGSVEVQDMVYSGPPQNLPLSQG